MIDRTTQLTSVTVDDGSTGGEEDHLQNRTSVESLQGNPSARPPSPSSSYSTHLREVLRMSHVSNETWNQGLTDVGVGDVQDRRDTLDEGGALWGPDGPGDVGLGGPEVGGSLDTVTNHYDEVGDEPVGVKCKRSVNGSVRTGAIKLTWYRH